MANNAVNIENDNATIRLHALYSHVKSNERLKKIFENEGLFHYFDSTLSSHFIPELNTSEERQPSASTNATEIDRVEGTSSDNAILLNVAPHNCAAYFHGYHDTNKNASIRIYTDGVFDLVHSAHFNAFRQSKAFGNYLVVGINSDEEVYAAKNAYPIFSVEERAEIVRACKWVDEVIVGTSYEVSVSLLDSLECDYAAHGDDLAISASGNDCYAEPRAANRLKIFKRTAGVSTTALLARIFAAASSTLPAVLSNAFSGSHCSESEHSHNFNSFLPASTKQHMFISSYRLQEFIGNTRRHAKFNCKVYIDGSFDLFHVGHLRALEYAKSLGDYLIVGIYDDFVVSQNTGAVFPIVRLIERAMNVLAMRIVDEVILGAPWKISKSLIYSYNIDIVVGGGAMDDLGQYATERDNTQSDRYEVAKKMGIFHQMAKKLTDVSTDKIIQRLVDNRSMLSLSINKRSRREAAYHVEQESGQREIVQEI